MAEKHARNPLMWMVIVAAPLALGLETLLRTLLFPPEFELIRELLRPYLTPLGWLMVAVIGLFGLLGWILQERLVKKRLARIPADVPERIPYTASFGVFLLTSSLPQVPTILATFLFMFGSHVAPVLTSVALCTVGVVAQGFRVPKLLARYRRKPDQED